MTAEKLMIRADANEQIGTGHVMRCLSVAAQAKKLGAEVVFISADERSTAMPAQQGYRTVCLNSRYDDLENELAELIRILCREGADRILVDSYYVTANYLSALRELAEVSYIDDVNAFPYPVDRLINYNLYGEDVGYTCPGCREYLLGAEYAPLREEFTGCERRKFEGIDSILITSGGTDPCNMAEQAVDRLLASEAFGDCELYCVLGRFFGRKAELEEKYALRENVHLLSNIPNMGFYMKHCDLAVSAAGSTTYELCACGIPGVIYTLADNQRGIAAKSGELGLLPWIGDVRVDMAACLDKMLEQLTLLSDPAKWEAASTRMQTFADGKGAARLAEKLLS